MRKKILFTFMVLFIIFVLCACSQKQKDEILSSGTNDIEINTEGKEDNAKGPQSSLEEKRILQDQSFTVALNDWGNVRFVSYGPDNGNDFEDVSFYLVKDNTILYSFPYFCKNNSTEDYVGLFDSVAGVSFYDVNQDTVKDVIVIINYVTGAGPQGMTPRPTVRIFIADKKEFYLATDLMNEITETIAEKDLTFTKICEFLDSKKVE